MTLADPSPAVAYLARPCQYLPPAQRAQCDPQLWMRARFDDEAIAALNAAVDRIKQDYRAAGVNLVGYSGGGAMAALLAARRSDVNCLVTIAAPLDTRAWTDSLGVSPLDRSLNPADYADRLRKVRQTHFRGMRDKVVAPATIGRYLERVTDAAVIDKAAFGHDCCWAEEWQELRRSSCLVQ
jgi:pimeloyl-ACP methyl ester carboxylesterase